MHPRCEMRGEPLHFPATLDSRQSTSAGWRTNWANAARNTCKSVISSGLANRYPSLGGSRVQIPPPPPHLGIRLNKQIPALMAALADMLIRAYLDNGQKSRQSNSSRAAGACKRASSPAAPTRGATGAPGKSSLLLHRARTSRRLLLQQPLDLSRDLLLPLLRFREIRSHGFEESNDVFVRRHTPARSHHSPPFVRRCYGA
jgi:hypothetical protein